MKMGELIGGPYCRAFLAFLTATIASSVPASANERAQSTKAKTQTGTIHVRVDTPGAEIRVGQNVVGTAPLEKDIFVNIGKTLVEVRKRGCTFDLILVDVEPGSRHDLSFACKKLVPIKPVVQPRSTWKSWAVPSMAILSAVGLGIGIGTWVHADAISRQAWNEYIVLVRKTPSNVNLCGSGSSRQDQDSCSSIRAKEEKAIALSHIWAPALIVGGVSATAALVMAMWPEPAGRTVRVVPVVGNSARGIEFSMSF